MDESADARVHPEPIVMRSDLKAPSSWEWHWTTDPTFKVTSSPTVIGVFSTKSQPSSNRRLPEPQAQQAPNHALERRAVEEREVRQHGQFPVPLGRPPDKRNRPIVTMLCPFLAA